MYDIGKTDPIALYEFAILIDAAGSAMLDPDSEIGKAYQALHKSAWEQLTFPLTIDISPE